MPALPPTVNSLTENSARGSPALKVGPGLIATLAISASLLLAGVLVDHTDPRVPIAVCASLALVYGIVWRIATRRLMRTSAVAPEPAAA
jgi:hypothetical protein